MHVRVARKLYRFVVPARSQRRIGDTDPLTCTGCNCKICETKPRQGSAGSSEVSNVSNVRLACFASSFSTRSEGYQHEYTHDHHEERNAFQGRTLCPRTRQLKCLSNLAAHDLTRNVTCVQRGTTVASTFVHLLEKLSCGNFSVSSLSLLHFFFM